MNHEVTTHGFAMARRVLDPGTCEELICQLGQVKGAGRRGLMRIPEVARVAQSPALLDLVRPHLPQEPVPVRSIFFDKSPESNWLVAWHQDLTIALKERCPIPGFGPWTMKEGIPHVQPPVELLEQMLTIRIHLDPADASNGALRVLPGSHRFGRLSPEQIQEQRSLQSDCLCSANAGDALLMRPLLLHASGRSTTAAHRRILHIEYAGFQLPEGAHWHEEA